MTKIKVGDSVKIVKPSLRSGKCEDCPLGWDDEMDKLIGREVTVKERALHRVTDEIRVKVGGFYFCEHSLERVSGPAADKKIPKNTLAMTKKRSLALKALLQVTMGSDDDSLKMRLLSMLKTNNLLDDFTSIIEDMSDMEHSPENDWCTDPDCTRKVE